MRTLLSLLRAGGTIAKQFAVAQCWRVFMTDRSARAVWVGTDAALARIPGQVFVLTTCGGHITLSLRTACVRSRTTLRYFHGWFRAYYSGLPPVRGRVLPFFCCLLEPHRFILPAWAEFISPSSLCYLFVLCGRLMKLKHRACT